MDKSKISKADVALMHECGFDVSSNNIVFSMRAAAKELAKLRAARRVDRTERLVLTALGAVGGAVVAFFIFAVLA